MAKRKLNPRIIRPGDTVRVIIPQFFVRCGYPKTLQGEAAKVKEKYKRLITEIILDRRDVDSDSNCLIDDFSSFRRRKLNKVINEIAHARLSFYGYGGDERKIYCEHKPELLNKEFVVRKVFFCNTGFYNPPNGYDDDWEPGYLDQMKTHKILFVTANLFGDSFEIQAENVIKIKG